MSKFDKSILKNLENLCRIKCTEHEEEGLLQALKEILSHVELLNEVKTDNVTPCSYPLKDMQRNVWREDEVKTVISNELFLENAPDHIGKMIKVPPILKQE